MRKLIRNESTQYIAFVTVVLLSRVPFLFSGYGIDADSWKVALTAKHIAETGDYEVSRFPGFPLHEIICSLFYNGSFVALNLLSTIISTIGFLFFAYTLKALRFKRVFLASFALAAVPVVYINSTTCIDYTWALTFILIGLYFVVKDKPMLAGIFLGIAISSRITSGAMLLPFAIMSLQSDGIKKNVIRILKLTMAACIVGSVLYAPVILKYGTDFFKYDELPYPSIPNVLYKLSIGVWGVAGFIGIVVATALLFLPSRITSRKYLFPRGVNEKFIVAWLVAIDLYIIAFLKLPMEAGYLIPLVPFVILIFGKYLYDKAFVFFAVIIIVSPFVAGISPLKKNDAPTPSPATISFDASGEKMIFDAVQGPVLSYQSRRENAMKFTGQFIHSLDTIHKKTLFILGWRWYYPVTAMNSDSTKNPIVFVDFVNQENLLEYIERGFEIYYLPQQDHFNKIKNGFDIKTFGAVPYIKDEN